MSSDSLPKERRNLRHRLAWAWYQSRLGLAWSNRCVRCIYSPFHGHDGGVAER